MVCMVPSVPLASQTSWPRSPTWQKPTRECESRRNPSHDKGRASLVSVSRSRRIFRARQRLLSVVCLGGRWLAAIREQRSKDGAEIPDSQSSPWSDGSHHVKMGLNRRICSVLVMAQRGKWLWHIRHAATYPSTTPMDLVPWTFATCRATAGSAFEVFSTGMVGVSESYDRAHPLRDGGVWNRAPPVARLLSKVRELLEWGMPCGNIVASLCNPMCSDSQRGSADG
jgi:hypothetical protein